jgi:hypothetical protein
MADWVTPSPDPSIELVAVLVLLFAVYFLKQLFRLAKNNV